MPIASWWSPIQASSNKVRMMNWWRAAVLTHDWARLQIKVYDGAVTQSKGSNKAVIAVDLGCSGASSMHPSRIELSSTLQSYATLTCSS
ncbi:hypothetical protein MES5069_490003 [Mesorhizobium escarrei]|uniref:Uncharacterized protein n=1 Tax=Mesorhizobium escarrei TaxID=666018 RepID=A0ABN8K614_9HYPH|nr:hypothetical protein MES5069_490003 [Mesorhizobium escarrei]